jgi:hypothetical protein
MTVGRLFLRLLKFPASALVESFTVCQTGQLVGLGFDPCQLELHLQFVDLLFGFRKSLFEHLVVFGRVVGRLEQSPSMVVSCCGVSMVVSLSFTPWMDSPQSPARKQASAITDMMSSISRLTWFRTSSMFSAGSVLAI